MCILLQHHLLRILMPPDLQQHKPQTSNGRPVNETYEDLDPYTGRVIGHRSESWVSPLPLDFYIFDDLATGCWDQSEREK